MVEKSNNSIEKDHLIVIILSGENVPERAVFGLAYALTAASIGISVTVFLAMDGAALASSDLEDRILLERYHSIPTYLKLLEEFGVVIMVCSTCIADFCEETELVNTPSEFNTPNSFTKPKPLRSGIKVMGIASLMSLTKNTNTNTVVF